VLPCFALGVSVQVQEMTNRAKNAYQAGDFDTAKKFYSQALALVQQNSDQLKVQGAILGDLGAVDYSLKDYSTAKEHFSDSLAIKLKNLSPGEIPSTLTAIEN
jgi:tetratricopeptide (TPR) repeat protein